MSERVPEVLVEGLSLPESPRWHQGALWFSDIFGGQVHRLTVDGVLDTVVKIEQPSGLGFLSNGQMVVVNMNRRELVCCRDGEVIGTVDLSGVAGGVVNDLVVDGADRVYIGDSGQTMEQTFVHGATGPVGQVLLVPPDGPPRVAGRGLVVPNGIGVLPDARTLIVAECFGPMCITAFTITEDGSLTGSHRLVQFSQGAPDGLCCDAEGGFWVAVHPRPGTPAHPVPPAAMSSGCEFVRVLNGRIVDRVPIEDRWPLACALGGLDRRTLYLCTAEPPKSGDARSMHKGWIEAVTVEVPGAGWP